MKKIVLFFMAFFLGVMASTAQTPCVGPTNLRARAHVPDYRNVTLDWTLAADSMSQTLSLSNPMVLSSSFGLNGGEAATMVPTVRFLPSDLAPMHGQKITAVSFAPGVSTSYASYSIVIWQGGGMSPIDYTFNPGTEIYNQPVTSTLVAGSINTVPLNTPITVDSTQELWVGIHITSIYGYPIYLTLADNDFQHNQNLLGNENHTAWDPLSVSSGNEYNFVIGLEVTSSTNLIQGYKIYRNQVPITPAPIANRTFVDSLGINGVYQYDVTAVYANNCESAPISASVTMDDDTCFIFELPFEENFDRYTGSTSGAVNNLPTCWHNLSGTASSFAGYPIMYNSTTYAASGRNSLRFYTTTASTDYGYQVAILPPIDINTYPINSLQVEFEGRANMANNNFTIVVGVMDNYYDLSTFQPLDTFTNTTTTYQPHIAFLDQYTGSGSYIALMAPRTVASNYGYLDNIIVSEIPTCPKPMYLTVSSSTSNSVTLAWTEMGGAQEWEVEYGPTGFALGTGTRVQAMNTTATISGLSPSGYYSFYVRSICEIGDTSVFSAKVDVAMDCGSINVFPYVQNFDYYPVSTSQSTSTNNLAQFCWSYINNGTSYKGCPLAYNSSGNAQSGLNALYYYNAWTNAYTDEYAISPRISSSIPMNSLMLEFSAKRTSYPFLIVVGIMSNPADESTFTALDTMYIGENEPNTYKHFLYMFDQYTGTGRHIALKNVKPVCNQCYNVGYIDDIIISQIPSCIKPGFVTATRTGSHDVTVDWEAYNNELVWEVVVVPAGNAPSSGTPLYAYTHPFTVDQLQADTEYDVYVRSLCDLNDFSQWSSVATFKTRCETISTLPYTMSFDSDGTATSSTATSPGPMVTCWDRVTDNTAPYPYISSAQHSSGVGSLYMYSTSTYYSMAVSQPLDLSAYSNNGVFMKYNLFKDNATSGRLQVGVSTNPDSADAFVLLDDIYGSDLPDLFTWYERFVEIPGPYNTPVYLVFRVPKGTTSGTYIDDVVVDEVVNCSAPRNLSYRELSPASVLITWDPAFFGAESYVLDYAEAGTSNWSNPVVTNGTSYRLSGLTPNTMYDVRVSSSCSIGSASPATMTFKTKCLAGGDAVFDSGVTEIATMPVNNQNKYSYSQQIFDASELNGASTINSVSFYYAFTTPLTAKNNVDIYLAHTNKSTFNSSVEDYISSANLQLVYSGNLNCVQGWNTFTFTNPFQYNGVDNLVLVVDDNSNNCNSSSYTFLSHNTTPDYKALYYFNTADINPSNPETGNFSSSRTTSRNNVIFGSPCTSSGYCVAPRVWVDSLAEHSIKLSWVPGYTETAWAVEYKSDQEMFWNSLGQVYTTSYTLTNLNENVNYDIRVCAICSTSDSSEWVQVRAHTPCQAVTLPYTQGFESATGSGATHTVDGCLTRFTTNTQTAYPYPNGSYVYEGNYSLYFYGSASNYSYLALPRMNEAVRMDSLLIQFRALKTAETYNIEVGIMEDPDDISTFTRLGIFSPAEISTQNNQKWDLGEVFTSGYRGQGRYVAFRTQQWLASYIYLDDITIDYIPSCRHITDLQVGLVQTTSAELSWTPGQDEQSWVYVYGPKGVTDPQTSSWQTVNQSSIVLNNLQPNTEYDFFVAANCGDPTPSQFMKCSFITNCGMITSLPYLENFDSYGGVNGSAFFPNCWYRPGSYSPNEYPYLYTVYYNSAPSSLYFYSQGNTYSLAVTNEFDHSISINSLQVSLYYESSTPSNYLEVGVMDDPENLSSFVPMDTIHCHVSNQFEPHVVSLAGYTGNGHFIAFKGTNMGYLDDVWIEPISNCYNPNPVTVTNITTTTATVRWFPGEDETQWEITIVPTGSTLDGTAPQIVQTDTFFNVTGLSAASTYDVYLRGICPNNLGYSGYVLTSFTTMCEALPLPYQEDFDSVEGTTSETVNNLPTCWQYYNTGSYYSGCPLVYKNATYAASGLNSLYFYTATSNSYSDQYAILPELDHSVTPLTNLELQFDARATSYYPFNLVVGVMSDPLDIATFTAIDTLNLRNPNYETFYMYFNNYTGTGNRIAFKAIKFPNTAYYNTGYVDNIVVRAMPTCMPVRHMSISHITSTTAEVSWDPNGTENAWDVQYRLWGNPDTSWLVLPVSNAPSTIITALSPNTAYEVRVRADCGQGDVSNWTAVELFRTECSPINQLPFTTDFESQTGTTSTSENNLPLCWHYLNTGTTFSGYPVVYSSSSYASSGDNSLRFYVHTSNPYSDQYAILPSVDTNLYPINTLKLSFMARKYTTSYASFNLLVGVMSDPYDMSTFVTVDSVLVMSDTISSYTTYFRNYVGNGSYVALKAPKVITINCNAGSVDDLVLSSAPMCLPVQDVTVSNLTATSMDLSWTPLGSETEWILKYSVDTVGGPSNTVVVTNTSSYSLTNLSPNTPYKIEIKSNCSPTESSVWSVPVYVVTECLPITSLPFTEDFSGYTHTINTFEDNNLPDCWNHVDLGASMSYYPIVYYNTSYAQSQPYSLRFYASPSASYSDQYAILPIIDVATIPMNSLQLSFGARKQNGTYPFTPIVGVMEGNDYNTFVPVDTLDVTGLAYNTYTVSFRSYAGNGNRIVIFHSKPAYSYIAGYIDDIVLDYLPCSVPESLTVSNVGANSATLSWTPVGLESHWNLQYKEASATTWTLVSNLSSPSYFLTNLQSNTAYQVQVQAVCGAGESGWTSSASFTTMNDLCPEPTNLHLVDTTNVSATLDWTQSAGTANEWTINYRKVNEEIWNMQMANTHPYELQGLESGASYMAQVVAHCTNGLFSEPSNTITFTTATVGVENYELGQTTIYPNPTTREFRIQNAEISIQSVEVYDVYGKLLISMEVNDHVAMVDASGLASGVYFTRICTDRGVITKRIVKK